MVSSTPLTVTGVMPVCNGDRFIAEALRSAFAQRPALDEFIVVNDGSTDDTPSILAHFAKEHANLRIIHQENRGLENTRNRLLSAATSEFLAFLDCDDIWPDGRHARLLGTLKSRPDIDIVRGSLQRFQTVGTANHFVDERRRAPCLSASLIRRSVFHRVGPFDPTLPHGGDVDWWLRADTASIPTVWLDEVVLHYRRHDDNLTNKESAEHESILEVLHRSIQRRRANVAADGGETR